MRRGKRPLLSAMNPQGRWGDTQWVIRRRSRASALGCHEETSA